MTIEFQKATSKDVPLIRKLAGESWRAAYREILSTPQIDYMLAKMYSEAEIFNQIKSANYEYYLISLEGTAVGFMGFEYHYEPLVTKLHRLYLIPTGKGNGLGKAALNLLKQAARRRGDRKIILNVNKNNPARKMYESQGFSVYTEAVVDIGNGFVMDDFLMECPL